MKRHILSREPISVTDWTKELNAARLNAARLNAARLNADQLNTQAKYAGCILTGARSLSRNRHTKKG